jgi:hypothetical protein
MWEHGSFAEIGENPDALVQRARIRVTSIAGDTVLLQGNLEFGGLRLRVQTTVDAREDPEQLVRTRLHDRLARFLATDTARYPGLAGTTAQAWLPPRDFSSLASRHTTRPTILRRKVVALRRETADDAAFFMDAMDYDFHLFFCVDTWQESVVFRCGPTGYKVAPLSLRNGVPQRRTLPITVSPRPAPRLTHEEARARLRRTEMPFVFFADAGVERPSGAVLYQRYDGHYGLLSGIRSVPHAAGCPAERTPASASGRLQAVQPVVVGKTGAGDAGVSGLERVVEAATRAGAGQVRPAGGAA